MIDYGLPRWEMRAKGGSGVMRVYAADPIAAKEQARRTGFKVATVERISDPEEAAHARRNDAQLMELRAKSPLRGKAGQHDASDLALFRAADEPSLF